MSVVSAVVVVVDVICWMSCVLTLSSGELLASPESTLWITSGQALVWFDNRASTAVTYGTSGSFYHIENARDPIVSLLLRKKNSCQINLVKILQITRRK